MLRPESAFIIHISSFFLSFYTSFLTVWGLSYSQQAGDSSDLIASSLIMAHAYYTSSVILQSCEKKDLSNAQVNDMMSLNDITFPV